MEVKIEMKLDQPSDVDDNSDRSQGQEFHRRSPGSFKQVNEEEREPITGCTIGLAAYDPSNRTQGGRSPCFYTSSNEEGSPSSPSSLPKEMTVTLTRHARSSSTTPDLTPPTVVQAPLLSPPASARGPLDSPSKPTVLYRLGEKRLEAEGFGPSKLNPSCQGGKGSMGKQPSKSVSRLCFPFVTTSPKRKDKYKERQLVPGTGSGTVSGTRDTSSSATTPVSPPPPIITATPRLHSASSPPRLHKYSCSPTRFCPSLVKRALPVRKHGRHAYANRGYSHEALAYVKCFWSVRQEGIKAGDEKPSIEKPQFARAVHPATTLQTQLRSSLGEPSPATRIAIAAASGTASATGSSEEKTVPASIHPRRGDISALRDPQCVEVDKTCAALNVWTIAKMVWIVEVMRKWEQEQEKEERRRRSRLRVRMLWHEDRSEDGEGSLGLLTRSTSTSSLSDDSEMTLVEDESFLSSCLEEDGTDAEEEDSDDMLQLVVRGRKLTPNRFFTGSEFNTSITTPSVSPGSTLDLDKPSIPQLLYQPPVEAPKSGLADPEWAADWMGQWEIVRKLSQEQRKCIDGSGGYNRPILSASNTYSAPITVSNST